MRNLRVSKRYATALMSAAVERGRVEEVSTDLNAVRDLLQDSRELALLIASPVVTASKKSGILNELFGGNVTDEVLTFFLLLTRKGREPFIPDIIEQFRDLYDQRHGIVDVRVHSALELEKDQEAALKAKLEKYTAMKIRMKMAVDDGLIGGVLIQIGDTVLDGSVRHQLEVLKSRFRAGETLS